MIKRIFILSILFTINSLLAKESIILIDDSKRGDLTQREIIGCNEAIIKEQKDDLEHIKHQLSIILEKLSKIEREKNITLKSKKIKEIRKSIKKLNQHRKRGTYITVRVKRGDRLVDYARRYYGNSKLYYKIYRVNRDKIGRDLKLRVGDKIIIPIDKHYIYKNKKIKNRKKRDIEVVDSVIIEKGIKKTPKKINYSRAKFISPDKDSDIKILDEPVYIEDEDNKIDTSGFIPLDEN